MSIVAADLVLYASLNMPENDTGLSGGGIDVDTRLPFTQLGADDDLEAFSSSAGDTTQTITVTTRDAAGVIDPSNAVALNGVTPVDITGLPATVERVLKAVLSADCAGTITLRRKGNGTVVALIPPGERGFHILYYDSTSEVAQTKRYEKGFFKNTHGTLALTQAKVQIPTGGDPSGKMKMALAASKDDSLTSDGAGGGNRKTDVPTALGLTFADDGVQQNVPTGTLGAGEAIGVWFEMTLAPDNAAIRSTVTVELAGAST